MSKIENPLYRYMLLFLILAISLYILFLKLHNSNTLAIEMNFNNLSPKIYYSNKGSAFSEQNSLNKSYSKGNIYYFNISKNKPIDTIRFDPATRNNLNISIKDIKVYKNSWFKDELYKIELNTIKPLHQIKNFLYKKNKIKFKTTGKDPQLILKFKLTKVYNEVNYHIELLILSIITTLVLIYLIELYRTKEFNEHLSTKLILYSIFLAFIVFKVNYYKDNIHFGYPPDEAYHYKYVEYVDKNLSFTPKFENMPHYLAHPPLYYDIMSLTISTNKNKRDNIQSIRTLSMLLYILSVILILYLGFSANLSSIGDFVYLSIISSIPMHSYIGASISNDTLAILGSILAILAIKRLIEHKYNNVTYILLSIGIFISFFAKLTAALLIFFTIIYYILHLFIKKEKPKFTKGGIVLVILFLIPIVYYQLYILLNYHAITPTYNVTHPKEFLQSNFYVAPEYRVHLTSLEWGQRMLHYIQGGWFGIHSHHSFGHEKWSGIFGLVILHILAILALFFKCEGEEYNFCKIGKITLLALFSVLIVQYLFSYKAHINNGYMGGLQPRYVLPFMFAFAIMAAVFVQRFQKSFWFTIFIIVISIQALYSDFFYFLLNYN